MSVGPDAPQPAAAPLGLAPIFSVSRRDGVIREIRRAIVLGTLRPGDRLTEGQLTTSLNVSRPTMREALTRLAQEGLLVQEPYQRLRVADLSPDEIMDLARTRVSLDVQAVQEILADSTGRRVARVERAWHEYNRLPMDADPVEAHEAHIAFHRGIWEASENTFLMRLWPVTEASLTIALARDLLTRNDPRRRHDAHERLVQAIVARDMKGVRKALKSHTVDAAAELVASMRAEAE